AMKLTSPRLAAYNPLTSNEKDVGMSFGGEGGAEIDFETARGRDWPSVRQFNVFVENRLGGLLNVVRRFETTDIRIVSLTIVDSADCAIIRMVLKDPERPGSLQASQPARDRERPLGGAAAGRAATLAA